jgi:hexosaminidase
VQAYIQSGYKDQATEAHIRYWLTAWRDNDAHLHTLLDGSSLLQEDVPLSQTLSALGTAGLQALDYIDKSQAAPDSWKTQQSTLIDQAKKPSADMLLMVAAPVQQLVDASATTPHN